MDLINDAHETTWFYLLLASHGVEGVTLTGWLILGRFSLPALVLFFLAWLSHHGTESLLMVVNDCCLQRGICVRWSEELMCSLHLSFMTLEITNWQPTSVHLQSGFLWMWFKFWKLRRRSSLITSMRCLQALLGSDGHCQQFICIYYFIWNYNLKSKGGDRYHINLACHGKQLGIVEY